VTQQQVVTLAPSCGLGIKFCPIPLSEFIEADEIFLVGTTIEVLPVIQVDEHPIQTGKPGPITTALQQKFTEHVAGLTRM